MRTRWSGQQIACSLQECDELARERPHCRTDRFHANQVQRSRRKMLFPVPSMKSWPLQRKSFIFCNIVASTKLPFVFYNIVGPICNFVKSDSRRSLPPPADPLIARNPQRGSRLGDGKTLIRNSYVLDLP